MHRLVPAATALFLVSSVHGALAQDLASQIVGTWEWAGHVYKEVATGRATHVFGEKPSGLMAFTRGGSVVYAIFADGRKAPGGNPATEAESVALFNTMGCVPPFSFDASAAAGDRSLPTVAAPQG